MLDTTRELVDGFRALGWSIAEVRVNEHVTVAPDLSEPINGVLIPLNPDDAEYEQQMAAASAHLTTMNLLTREHEGPPTVLPWTSMTVDDARRELTKWHFAKETLSEAELGLLYLAEGLLRLVDQEADSGARH